MHIIVDCAAIVQVVGKRLAKKLGLWKTARMVNARQVDGLHLPEDNFVVDISFYVFDFVTSPTSPTVSSKFPFDAEVLDIGNQDCIFCLSSLTENGFLVDTSEHRVKNAISGHVMPCSVRWILLLPVMDLYLEPLEDSEIVLIMDASE